MQIYPLKKVIIIYGWHLDQIEPHSSEERLLKLLKEKSFECLDEISDLNIDVFKSTDFNDHCKRTHVTINFSGEITEIKHLITRL